MGGVKRARGLGAGEMKKVAREGASKGKETTKTNHSGSMISSTMMACTLEVWSASTSKTPRKAAP